MAVAPENFGWLFLEAVQRNLPRIGAPFLDVADHPIQAVAIGLITLTVGSVEVAVRAQIVIGESPLPNVTLARTLHLQGLSQLIALITGEDEYCFAENLVLLETQPLEKIHLHVEIMLRRVERRIRT